MTRITFIAFTLTSVLALAASAASQFACAAYDSSFETLPTSQGWTEFSAGTHTESATGGTLSQSTLPYAPATCPETASTSQSVGWLATPTFNFDDGVVFEAEVRIVDSQYGINVCTGWARPGFEVLLRDEFARTVRLGFGNDTVFLENASDLAFGDAGLVEAPFDTTDAFHVYRIEVDGGTAQLFIDGALTITLASLPTTVNTPNQIFLGDGTVWANSEARVRNFSVSIDALSPEWTSLGEGLTGTTGLPCHVVQGAIAPGAVVSFTLDGALPGSGAFLVFGIGLLEAPFKGGTLVPDPLGLFGPLPVSVDGQVAIPAALPSPPVGGVPTYTQWWIADAGGPAGFSASNAAATTIP